MRGASSPQLNVDPQLQRQQSVHETRFAKESQLGTAIQTHSSSMAGALAPPPGPAVTAVNLYAGADAMALHLSSPTSAWPPVLQHDGSSSAGMVRLPMSPLPVVSAVVTTGAPKAEGHSLTIRGRALMTGTSVSALDPAAIRVAAAAVAADIDKTPYGLKDRSGLPEVQTTSLSREASLHRLPQVSGGLG